MTLQSRLAAGMEACATVGTIIWTVAGQFVGLLGVFFLSVEAIKLDNLARLRDRVLPKVRLAFETPKFREFAVDGLNPHRGLGGRPFLYYLIHLVVPIVTLSVAELVRQKFAWGGEDWIWSIWWHWRSNWKWVVLVGAALTVFYVLPYTIGCWLHQSLALGADGAIWGLKEIERRTPTGGIGMIGFAITAIGVSAQIVGSVLAA